MEVATGATTKADRVQCMIRDCIPHTLPGGKLYTVSEYKDADRWTLALTFASLSIRKLLILKDVHSYVDLHLPWSEFKEVTDDVDSCYVDPH